MYAPSQPAHSVFNHETFLSAFIADLNDAQGLALIQSPYLTTRRIEKLSDALNSCILRKVRVCVITQLPDLADHRPSTEETRSRTQAGSDLLRSMDIHVTLVRSIHEKLVLIDEDIAWEGTMNVLSHSHTSERMTRWRSREKVKEILQMHNLDQCTICSNRDGFYLLRNKAPACEQRAKILGKVIADRRKQLGMSQYKLAKLSGQRQSTISEIESGKRDCRMSTLFSLLREIDLDMRALPLYLIPSTENRCDHDSSGYDTD